MAAQVFGAAPRALAGVISLQQTVDLVRLGIEVVETNLDAVLDPDDARDVHAGVLRYGREVAFATAEVYARAAEVRGAWDARLEALVVDSVLRAEADETMLSRASALGWGDSGAVAVVLGAVQPDRRETATCSTTYAAWPGPPAWTRSAPRQGDRLVVVLGGVERRPEKAARAVLAFFGPGPVVVGPAVDDLEHAHVSARSATSAHRAADRLARGAAAGARRRAAPRTRPGRRRPRPAPPGRGGVPAAASAGRDTLVETLATYFAQGRSLEATARALFCHPNTVRYRLRQVGDLTGLTPTDARDAFTLEIALVLGRQSGRE